MTFSVLRVSLTVSMSMATVGLPVDSSTPRAYVMSRTGMPAGPPSVPPIRVVRSSLLGPTPSL